jgi:hypothetical protein
MVQLSVHHRTQEHGAFRDRARHHRVQVHAIGPFQLTYVNPADDPTKK